MQRYPDIRITPGFCIIMAIGLLVLPLKWVFGWLGAVAIHELAHLIALVLFDVRIMSVKLDVGGASIQTAEMILWQELMCALAGPLLGLIPVMFFADVPYMSICAVILSAFNLIPVYPLDGGRALFCICRMFLSARSAIRFCTLSGRIVLILLFAVSVALSCRFECWMCAVAGFLLLLLKFRDANPSCKERELIVQ